MPQSLRVWFPILVTPMLPLAQLSINYPLVLFACENQVHLPLHLVSAVLFVLTLAGAAMAWSAWREAGTAAAAARGHAVSQLRIKAVMGLLQSALMALSVAAQWLTTAFIPPCVR
jgi:hypothetical protein